MSVLATRTTSKAQELMSNVDNSFSSSWTTSSSGDDDPQALQSFLQASNGLSSFKGVSPGEGESALSLRAGAPDEALNFLIRAHRLTWGLRVWRTAWPKCQAQ
ncbi:hypothetical protein E3N88_08714 [Mikania micrantha]|uniref:Uncharacterized protein n=1 Tax=Mikania micrantha TaxID=192012 RepID=A0A5N6PHZ8_9ASTR|nr:hypothetical protein E3N88_08714 [Mikania micrantha]